MTAFPRDEMTTYLTAEESDFLDRAAIAVAQARIGLNFVETQEQAAQKAFHAAVELLNERRHLLKEWGAKRTA